VSDGELLKVHMLGEFSLTLGPKTINDQSNRSKKVWTLLEYLIAFRDREISQNDLIDLLWPDGETINPAGTLKTLLHRARAAISELGFCGGKELVVSLRGTYAWNTGVPMEVDADLFDAACRAAGTAEDREEKLDAMFRAVSLYRGDFLPRSAAETWVVPISAYYHAQYLKIVHETLTLLNAENRSDEIISICQKAVVIDPYDESLHQALILALAETGQQQAALQHYEYVTELFFKQFGVTPSPELTSLYREIVRTNNELETDLNVIKQDLAESTRKPGAFFCEYEFFKDIYNLSSRSCARSGQVIQIALITVTGSGGEPLPQKALNQAMDHLNEIVACSLRRGDVFCRYSVPQFLLMLPSSNFEDGDMVLRRILRNYRKKYPKADVALHYKILPLDPEY